jgi:hypothetical protein
MSGGPQLVGQAARDRIFVRLFTLVTTAGGLAMIVAGALLGGWPSVLCGGFFLTAGAYFHVVVLARRRPGRRVEAAPGPAGVEIRIGLRPHRPLSLLCLSLSLAMMLGGAALVIESPLGQAFMWILLPLPLLLLPDAVRGLFAHGRGFLLTPQVVSYRGWSYDVDVPWEEIAGVGIDTSDPQLTCVRVDLRPGAHAQAVRHKLLIWVEPKPQPDNFQVPTLALDQPAQLAALLSSQSRVSVQTRSAVLAHHGVAIVSGQDRWA